MKRLTLLVFSLLIVAFSQGIAQLPQPSVIPPVITPPMPPLPTIPAVQPPKEKSLDQLLDELETLRKQKAEMEKKEQELVKLIQQKADKQVERMKQLGVVPNVTGNEPIRIGKIKIEGNETTTAEAIFKMVKFRSGEVLNYPMIEQARTCLLKAGFQRVAVEVSPNEPGSPYVDILIKIVEKDK